MYTVQSKTIYTTSIKFGVMIFSKKLLIHLYRMIALNQSKVSDVKKPLLYSIDTVSLCVPGLFYVF